MSKQIKSLTQGKEELNVSIQKLPRWKPSEKGMPKTIIGKVKKEITITPKDGKQPFNVFEFENVLTDDGEPFCKNLQVQCFPKLKSFLKNESFGIGDYVGITFKGLIKHPTDKMKTINDVSIFEFTFEESEAFEKLKYPNLDENFNDIVEEEEDDLPY